MSALRRCRDGGAAAGGKRRVITLMKKQSASKPHTLTNGPPASRNPIALVKSLEREFDRWQALTLDKPIIDTRLDRQQAEPSVTLGLQPQVGRIGQIEIVDVPQFRLDDAPRTEERALRSSTCSHRVHANRRRSITQSRFPARSAAILQRPASTARRCVGRSGPRSGSSSGPSGRGHGWTLARLSQLAKG